MNGTNVVREVWVSARHTLVFAAMTILFTLAITGIAQVAFNSQANGSLITVNGQVVGSKMIGQSFMRQGKDAKGNTTYSIDPRFFQGRLSYTVDASGNPDPYNAANSAGSNYGPSNPKLIAAVAAAVNAYRAQGLTGAVPIDLVTSDFTGFDPDISEAAALFQVPMVARARGLDPARVTALVESQLQGRILWVFGEPHINVLQLNMALDAGGAGG
jgi:potassium-transporting ATPase KdpC subunit